MLSTRLRYAVFKVENGWTRQSLSEVENLFYRRQVSLSKPSNFSKESPNVFDNRKCPGSSPPSPTLRGDTPQHGRPLGSLHDSATYADFWNHIDTTKMSPKAQIQPVSYSERSKVLEQHHEPHFETTANPSNPDHSLKRPLEIYEPSRSSDIIHLSKEPTITMTPLNDSQRLPHHPAQGKHALADVIAPEPVGSYLPPKRPKIHADDVSTTSNT